MILVVLCNAVFEADILAIGFGSKVKNLTSNTFGDLHTLTLSKKPMNKGCGMPI
jgi:hypothetical protein